MSFTPIIIFAFNRYDSLQNTINSLLENSEAKNCDIFIFVDGARKYIKNENKKVKKVQDYVKSINGFKSVNYYFNKENNGLGASIIHGVSKIINKYGKAIILEDDLIFAKNFLSYMNQGLDKYKEESKVFSICGYSNTVKVPKGYVYDTYFCTRSSSWGWGTWADRWNSVDWDLKDWDRYSKMKHSFNKWGGSDCFKMLNDWKYGRNQSWAIRFCFAQFLQNKLSLFPIESKVCNNGFDGNGTNCKKWSRFRCKFDKSNNKTFTFSNEISLNKELYKSAVSYHKLGIRFLSKLMYLIHG